jgi:hypothetical protein
MKPFPVRENRPAKPIAPIRPVTVPERFAPDREEAVPSVNPTTEPLPPVAFDSRDVPESPASVEHMPSSPPDMVPVAFQEKADQSPVSAPERLPESKIGPLPALLRRPAGRAADPEAVFRQNSGPPELEPGEVVRHAPPQAPDPVDLVPQAPTPPMGHIEHRTIQQPEVDVEALLAGHGHEEPPSFFQLEGIPLLSEMRK